jgi:hypothetical protein
MGKTVLFWLLLLSAATSVFAEQSVLLRYKPRLRESIYTYYSRGDSLFKNAGYEKMVTTNSQLYVSMRTVKTLENGYLVQRTGINAGNINVNGQLYSHPALGEFVEYVLTPWGGIPQAIGNGNQFKVKEMQLVLPKEPVSVGSSWTVTMPSTVSFPVNTEVKYEVTNILGSLVIIHAKTDMRDKEVIPGLLFTMTGTAQVIFNSEEGILLRNESNQYLEVKRRGKAEHSTRMNSNSILELQF